MPKTQSVSELSPRRASSGDANAAAEKSALLSLKRLGLCSQTAAR